MTDLLDTQETPALSGAGLLGLVTTGMYGDPLSMYREYIQNAADAAAGSGFPDRARVEITVDVTGRQIRIRDNGPGLSGEQALARLLPIGRSDKRLGTDRGFRGVGRLAGLAFAKTVSFTTRACENQSVTRIIWHSDRLPELTSTESELEQAILGCVDVETLGRFGLPRALLRCRSRRRGASLRRTAARSAGGARLCWRSVPGTLEYRVPLRRDG